MSIIDQYLSEIARSLPLSKSDVVDEIRDDIMSRIDERAESLGRLLSEREVVQLLHDYGSPTSVASSFSDRRSFISVELLPTYYLVLSVAMSATIAIAVLGDAFRAITFDNVSFFWKGLATNWESPIFTVGLVTLFFLAYDRFPQKRQRRWKPRSVNVWPIGLLSALGVAIDLAVNGSVLVFLLTVAPSWGQDHSAVWHPIIFAVTVSSLVNVVSILTALSIKPIMNVRPYGAVAAAGINIWGLSSGLRAVASTNVGLRAFLGMFMIFVMISFFASVWKIVSRARRMTTSPQRA